MKNPLSYKIGSIFSGKEINDWCVSQLHKWPSREAAEARRLLRKNYNNERVYISEYAPRDTGCGSQLMIVFRKY